MSRTVEPDVSQTAIRDGPAVCGARRVVAPRDCHLRKSGAAYGIGFTLRYNTVINPNDQLASVSYSTSPVTSQRYLHQNANQPYALTSIQDENGATYKTWTYDSFQRGLTSQTGGLANLFTVTYNE